jgi:hypothetical protein
MVKKKKRTKWQTTIYNTLHKKLITNDIGTFYLLEDNLQLKITRIKETVVSEENNWTDRGYT